MENGVTGSSDIQISSENPVSEGREETKGNESNVSRQDAVQPQEKGHDQDVNNSTEMSLKSDDKASEENVQDSSVEHTATPGLVKVDYTPKEASDPLPEQNLEKHADQKPQAKDVPAPESPESAAEISPPQPALSVVQQQPPLLAEDSNLAQDTNGEGSENEDSSKGRSSIDKDLQNQGNSQRGHHNHQEDHQTADVPHRQPEQRRVQRQAQLNKRRQKLVRRIVLTNDMTGRMSADIERVFRFLGHPTGDQYRAYILNPDLDFPCVLDNIAGFLSGINYISNAGSQRLDIPVDEEQLLLWIQTLDEIEPTPKNKTTRRILVHALKCIRDRKAEPLPAELEDAIFEVDTAQVVSDMTQSFADNTEQQLTALQDMNPEDIQFTKKPLLEYNLQEIQRSDARRRDQEKDGDEFL